MHFYSHLKSFALIVSAVSTAFIFNGYTESGEEEIRIVDTEFDYINFVGSTIKAENETEVNKQ